MAKCEQPNQYQCLAFGAGSNSSSSILYAERPGRKQKMSCPQINTQYQFLKGDVKVDQ